MDMRSVLDNAFPLLMRVIAADQGALCVSNPAAAGEYDWGTLGFAVDWFSTYAEDLAPHDFVREAAVRSPNVVLRDSEMIARPDLQANVMYRRAVDMRMPLEQVMTVMLECDRDWHAGITLYRGRPRPFSDREQNTLQELTRPFKSAVRRCKSFETVSRRSTWLESVLAHQGFETVVMAAASIEIDRTPGIEALLRRWFTTDELDRRGLPLPIVAQLEKTIRQDGGRTGPLPPWTRTGADGARLEVTIVAVPEASYRAIWTILFKEHQVVRPAWEAPLTAREREVVYCVVRGWDNRLIAGELHCTVGTVKKHIYNIFVKLGIEQRTALCNIVATAAMNRVPGT
jgi:DNA-binding CsgD family transcriptional regulator